MSETTSSPTICPGGPGRQFLRNLQRYTQRYSEPTGKRRALCRGAALVLLLGLGSSPVVSAESAAAKTISREIIVWIRGTTPEERSLDADLAPVLRSFVRRGCTFPKMRGETASRKIIERLRSFRKSLGSLSHEIIRGAETSGSALADLVAELGSAPEVSREEKEAIRRLKNRTGDHEENSNEDSELERELKRSLEADSSVTDEASKAKPTGKATMDERLGAALLDKANKAQLYLIIDPRPEGSLAGRNEELAKVARSIFAFPSKIEGQIPERLLILILVSEDGEPSIVTIGHSIKKARVFAKPPSIADVLSGLRVLLALPHASKLPGDSTWVDDILVEWASRGDEPEENSSGGGN